MRAAAPSASGIEYARAGSRLMELTAVFSQSLGAATTDRTAAIAQQERMRFFIVSSVVFFRYSDMTTNARRLGSKCPAPCASRGRLAEEPRPETARGGRLVADERLAVHHHLALLGAEGRLAARAGGGVRHDEGDGVRVAGLDRGVRVLARADAFHPVAHVRGGERVAARVRARDDRLLRRGQVRLLPLLALLELDAFVGHLSGAHVDAAVRAEVLLDGRFAVRVRAAAAVVLVALEHALEALALHAALAVFEDGRERVVAHAPVGPLVETARGDGALRIGDAHEPGDRVDLVAHPLARRAGRERPEEAELEVLARIEGVRGRIAVEQPHVPVDVLLLQRGDERLRTAPALGLVHVPAEVDVGDVAERAGVDERLRGVVLPAGTALGADLEDRARQHLAARALRLDRVLQHVGAVHVLGQRLLAVGILAGVDRMGGVLRVLEVGRGDDDGVDVLRVLVEGDVAGVRGERMAELLLHLGLRVLHQALLPEVGDRHEVELQLLVVVEETRQQRIYCSSAASRPRFSSCIGGTLCELLKYIMRPL